MSEKVREHLRAINDLQHRMAIELDAVPCQPRIEFYTRQIEEHVAAALAEKPADRPQLSAEQVSEVFAKTVNNTDPEHPHLYDHRLAAELLNRLLTGVAEKVPGLRKDK